MNCRNGHTYEQGKVRSDGYTHCPVCYREGQARRDKRRADKPERGARRNERRRLSKVGW